MVVHSSPLGGHDRGHTGGRPGGRSQHLSRDCPSRAASVGRLVIQIYIIFIDSPID